MGGHHETLATEGKTITCKAAILWGPGKPFVIEKVEVDPPQWMEVRVKIFFTSICHTDLSAWKGDVDIRLEQKHVFPRILGHEAAGVVESVGGGVEGIKAGDHVIPIFHGECGNCANCKSERTNLCAKYKVNPLKSTMTIDGKTRFFAVGHESEVRVPVYHFLNTSTFAEYTVLDSACVVKINPEAPLDKICLFSCGISTGIGAAWNTANVKEGSTVAIFGLGALGLAVAEGARLRGASKIMGIDINPEKFAKGKEMGITDFINMKESKTPASEIIKEMTDGGVDYSFECTGNLDVIREAFISTREGWGMTVILGVHYSPQTLPLHPMELFKGRTITGTIFGDYKGKTQLPGIIDKCMKGELKINLEGFITHELPFAEINKAFQLMKAGKALRCLLRL